MDGRIMVMGDIHGKLEFLKRVFERSKFDFENDTLIQLGDICDRGEHSFEVVELLKNCRNLILIEGNHDQWFKEAMSGDEDMFWLKQGGSETLQSYKNNNADIDYHRAFYDSQVRYYIDNANNFFVHGGFDRRLKIADQDSYSFAWDRNLVTEMMACQPGVKLETADNFNHIYIGHTPTTHWGEFAPIVRGGITNMDTGAGKSGFLTIMDLATKECWTGDSQDSV